MTDVPDAVAEKAEQVRVSLQSQVDAIRADTDLTSDAKKRRITEVHDTATQQMDALKSAWKADRERIKKTAMRDLFGSSYSAGADAISIRDAEDRASHLEKAGEARELLDRARRNGDKVLERAVGLEAMQRSESLLLGHSWSTVLEEFLADNPIATKQFESLRGTQDHGTDWFANGLNFLLPSRPWL